MITRAHIRRQLRASGGITNVMPREGYFLGSIVRGAKKAVGKVADVAKQVVKSPIGKAAILGLGASYLGPKIMSGGGLKSFFGAGSFNPLRSIVERGPTSLASQSGLGKLLGKVGLTTETGGITGLGKMLGAGGILGYFTSKGASEEEAKELAQDVYRGEGLGFDQIRKDIAAYRAGGQDESQMAAKGYRFLTPRNFVGAEGGRVGLRQGSPEEGIKSLEAGALPIKVEGDVRPKEMKMAAYEPGKATTGDLYDLNNPDYQGINKKIVIEFIQEGIPLGYRSPEEYYEDFYGGYKKGGRVGLKSGGDPLPEDPTKPINPFGPKPTGPVLPNKMAEIPKGLSMQDAVKTFTLSNGRKPKSVQEVIEFFKNRKLSAEGGRIGYGEGGLPVTDEDLENVVRDFNKQAELSGQPFMTLKELKKILGDTKGKKYKVGKAMGGIMDMPTGNMRRNQAGVMERDYRDKGGFVPVGVKEKADDVPAMLSKNEFVMTADAVRGAGDGNIKKGAQRMYDLMKRNEGKVA